MKRLIAALAVFSLVLFAPVVLAVGTVTVTNVRLSGTGHLKYTVAWTSDASGDVNTLPFTVPAGYISQALFDPDGTTAPTDLYDATFTYGGVDVIQGSAADLSSTTNTMILFNPPVFYDGKSALELVISNAGNAKLGVFTFWLQPSR